MPEKTIAATKGLYRRLESVLGRLSATDGDAPFLTSAAQLLFEAFATDLDIEGVDLAVHSRAGFEPLAAFGRSAPEGGEALESFDVAGQRVHLIEPGRREARPLALLEIPDGERIWRLRFAFGPGWNRDAAELVLHTAGSILVARRSEANWGAVLRQAAEIQQSLLPDVVPEFPGYRFAAHSRPAEAVGGDWFDFLPLGEGALGLSIGDASGHGLPAALMARDVVIGLRMGVEQELRAGHVLRKLNRVLHRSTLSSCFASLLFGELEENGSFFYYSAGHDAPLLVNDEGVRSLRTGGPVLGPLPEIHLRRHFAHLDHGTTLVLHTDGLIERRSRTGELFGIERLRQVLFEERSATPQRMLERVFEAVEAFAEGSSVRDDETLVVVRRPG